MIAQEMYQLGASRSCIRELFEYGLRQAAVVGKENVYDFSLGNPSIPAPEEVRQAFSQLIAREDSLSVHGYTPAPGSMEARSAVAADLNARFQADIRPENLFLTCGAAPALISVIRALAVEGAEIMAIAPFFPEYRPFAESNGAKFVVVPADRSTFQIPVAEVERRLTPHTQAIIVNSPNNPSGVVYSRETLERLAEILGRKEEEYGHPIYLISDEPYREIVYQTAPLPWVPDFYDNTLVCYSYSKSLSLPGQRIGYVLVPPQAEEADLVYAAICGAGRALGYVCAPSLFQLVVARCAGQTADMAVYRRNRDLFLDALRSMGYTCAQPEGAFYLFPRSLEPDAAAFCERARKYDLILVSGDSFGCPGHVRISYCVPTEQIQRALPKFRALAREYGVGG